MLLMAVSMARAPAAAFTTSTSSLSPHNSTRYFTLSLLPSHRFTCGRRSSSHATMKKNA